MTSFQQQRMHGERKHHVVFTCGWDEIIDKDEDSLFLRKPNPLSDHIGELPDRQVCGN